MANGDAALAAGMTILTGDDDRRLGYDEINKTRDYIAQRTNTVTPVAKGGTGAVTAAAALTSLGALPASDVVVSTSGVAVAGKVPRYDGSGRLVAGAPGAANHATPKTYVDNAVAAVPRGVPATGGTFTGNVFFPNSTAATTGYTVAYINSDGRLSRGASSERYKQDITPVDPAALGDIFPQLHHYRMRGDDVLRVGWIAERLAESDALRPFVVYQSETSYDALTDEYSTRQAVDENGQPIPDSIDFIALLIAQNAQLHQQLDLLAQRLAVLEGPTDVVA